MNNGFRPMEPGLCRFIGGPEPRIELVSPQLLGLPCLPPVAGDFRVQVASSTLHLERDCWVLLAVSEFGDPAELPGWQDLPHGVVWRFPGTMRIRADRIVARRCEAGPVEIPGNTSRSPRGFWSRPHLILLADELPAPPGPGEDRQALLATLTSVEAITLRNGELLASVQIRPCLRLSAFGRRDLPSLIAPGDREPGGVRTWFMSPAQDWRSSLIGLRTAHVLSQSDDSCTLTTGIEPVTGLEVRWEVRLTADRLVIRHALHNHSPAVMHAAVWSIIAGANPDRSTAILLRGAAQRPALRIIAADPDNETGFALTPGPWPDSEIEDSPDGVIIAPANTQRREHIKIGLRSPEGLCALIDGDDALLSQVQAEHPGPYPEGDHNLTSYRSRDIIEIEHVGPLQDLATGSALHLHQELRAVRLPGLTLDQPAIRCARLRQAWLQG